jgi:hypothetical protein
VVLHVAGLVLALVGMRPGTPSAPEADRMAYLAGRPIGWTLGWAVWALCALALLWFMTLLSEYRPSTGSRLALALTTAGVAVDLTCDAWYATVLPELATPVYETPFLIVERLVGVASLAAANGLYSTGVLVAAATLERVPKAATWLGCAAGISGLALAAAGLAGSPTAIEVCTGPTVGFFMAWTVALARGLARSP